MRKELILLAATLTLVNAQDLDLHVTPSIDPELRDHTRLFDKKIYPIGATFSARLVTAWPTSS